MEKSGLTFVLLLFALLAIVLSLALFGIRQPIMSPDDGSLIPQNGQDQPQHAALPPPAVA